MKITTLLATGSLFLVSCAEKEQAKVEPKDDGTSERVGELEGRLVALREELVAEQNMRLREKTETAASLSELKELLLELKEAKVEPVPVNQVEPRSSLKASEMSLPVAPVLDDPVDSAELKEARRTIRLKAKGEKHAILVTNSGMSFMDVVITRVSDIGVAFLHRDGSARIDFSDLPKSWQARFFHDPKRAEIASKQERLAQARYNRLVEAKLLAKHEKEADRLRDRSFERLAAAVERINQPQAQAQPQPAPVVVQEEILVDRPVIVPVGQSQIDEEYCPPVVTTPTVRPRVIHPTVVRNRPSPTVSPQRPNTRPTPQRPSARPQPTVERPAPRATSSTPAVQQTRPTPQRSTPTPAAQPSRPAPQPTSPPGGGFTPGRGRR